MEKCYAQQPWRQGAIVAGWLMHWWRELCDLRKGVNMAWPQIYCPQCKKHLSHKSIIKRLPRGVVYQCVCGHKFGWSPVWNWNRR